MTAAQPITEQGSTKGPQLVPQAPESDPLERLFWLPCTLTIDLPLVKFTLGDLLRLTEGNIVETDCAQTSDLPLRINGRVMGWTEFEVVGEQLAVRLTDLA